MLGGISPATFARWRKEGIIPPPVPGTNFYHPEQVRNTINRRSGFESDLEQQTATSPPDALSSYKSWKMQRNS